MILHEHLTARHRVLRLPPGALDGAELVHDSWYFELLTDVPTARLLAQVWALAADQREALVHLPTVAGQLDLLLVHHTLQFPAHDWRALRRATRHGGAPRTFPQREVRRPDEGLLRRRHFREFRDRFHQRVAADTLVLSGSAAAFADTAWTFEQVAVEGPGYRPRAAWDHYSAQLLDARDGTLGRHGMIFHVCYRAAADG